MVAIAASVILIGGVQSSSAQSAMESIKQRQALMKNAGGAMKAVFGFLKKDMGTPAQVGSSARRIAANMAMFVDLFPRGTSMNDGMGKTRSKPEIWQQRAAFEDAAANAGKLAWALSAASRSGDKKAIGAAAGALGKNGCGGCHKTFRGPKQ